ncbi:hypothetical protein KW851_06485 [Pseudomonas sp. PDM33]|uniref:hypothetical protein n=1 Tax=Pseudomonas sp. PDM33 TaxID=2854765 RepID=UPI001C441839|nr:hypothetical protein [Pseudomonas sp. PDM33]MBV7582456.1 hypothetical protein [Pseudomonas sp. PDM33]
MDLLAEIKNKINNTPLKNEEAGIESVLLHIEIAERHHHRAKSERDEHLYTDVIYRTNHAFEGVLKEAYSKLAEKSPDALSPYQIEEYLLTNKILRSRVADLLTNYRKNWRNPSTHDHKLFFAEQESFLAIVTVSAFASILIDQILDKLAYTQNLNNFEIHATKARNKFSNYEEMSAIDKLSRLISGFSDYYLENFQSMSLHSRTAANSALAAFITKADPSFVVTQETHLDQSEKHIAFDLIAEINSEKIVVETRDPRPIGPNFFESEVAVKQLAIGLRKTGIRSGVIFYYPAEPGQCTLITTASTSWPSDCSFREVYTTDPSEVPDDEDYLDR